MGVSQGSRVIVATAIKFGPGYAEGPVTQDNEGIWLVHFDTGKSETFDFHKLLRVFDL